MIMRVIAVGKLKEKYWQKGIEEYAGRLRPYVRLDIVEVPEARAPDGASLAEKVGVMDHEAKTILERLDRRETLKIALDRKGESIGSEELAKLLEEKILDGCSEITWIIGGPLGLAPSVIEHADLIISLSKLTFPHQMARLILLEQIYRSFRIIHHEPYHK